MSRKTKIIKSRQLSVDNRNSGIRAKETYVGSSAIDVIVKGIMEEISGVRNIANTALTTANNALPKTGGIISGNLGIAGNVVATGEGTFHNTTASVSDTIRKISSANDINNKEKLVELELVANVLLEEINKLKLEISKEENNK